MQHTLVAVFDNRGDAQQALEELVSSGFSRQTVRLSEDDSTVSGSSSASGTANTTAGDASIGTSIKNFFADLFGDRDDQVNLYSTAVNRGNFVLTLSADSEPEVERAADVVERYGPIDIDEHSQQWGAGTYASDSMRAGSGSMSQSQSFSQQNAQQNAQQSSVQGSQLSGSQQRADATAQGQTAIPVIQEELAVGKREVSRGGVRVYQRVVETPVNETIGLREEHVNVERHAVDRPVSPGDLDAFKEGTIELRETAEEAIVQKTARVVEEVVVGKDVTQRQQNISDSVRRTEVEIEQLSPEDDNYYRSHWSSNFANAGGTYDDYAPAYQYGNSMARSDSYRGRQWDDVEGTLRTDWESRNPGSTWEKIKAAVRHGWERMTS